MPNELTNPRVTDAAVIQLNETIKNADRLKEILAASIEAPPALSADAVARTVSTKTGIPFLTIQAILNALDNLDTLKADNDSADGAIESVIRTFGKDTLPGIDEARERIREAIDSYTVDNPVAISLKARRLAYLFEKLFIESEIITDARPVYNTEGSEILEYVISHCLLLTYHEDSGVGTRHNHPRVHIALDLDDIFALREVCNRAIVKSETLKKDLGAKARVLGDDG